MNNRILLTGATGFVGQAVLAACVERGLDVRVAVRRREQLPQEQYAENAPHVQWLATGDIHGQTDWQEALDDVACVVHLAARVHVMRDAARDPAAEFQQVNTDGTGRLARQAAAAGVRRLVFMSSIKVNGEATGEDPFTEADTPAPVDYYGKSKLEAEERLWQISRETGMEIVVIRPPLVYGSGVKGNLARLRSWLKRGVPLPLGAIHNARSLVELGSLAELVLLCASRPEAAGEVFLAADQEYVSTPDIVRALAGEAGVRPRLWPLPPLFLRILLTGMGKADMAARLLGDLRVSADKAWKLLDWEPRVRIGEY